MLKADMQRVYNQKKDKTSFRKFLTCYRSPGVHAVIIFRFGHWLLKKNLLFNIFLLPIYALLNHRMKSIWGIEIARGAKIGEGFYIGHYGGIIVGASVKIGKNVSIFQQVTIGISGQGNKRGCPVIGDNVIIAPGAKLFGKIYIGNNVRIGPNSVIYKDVPGNSICSLKTRIVAISGIKFPAVHQGNK